MWNEEVPEVKVDKFERNGSKTVMASFRVVGDWTSDRLILNSGVKVRHMVRIHLVDRRMCYYGIQSLAQHHVAFVTSVIVSQLFLIGGKRRLFRAGNFSKQKQYKNFNYVR